MFSPFEIVFGRKIEYPSSVVVDPPIHPYTKPSSQEVESYVRLLKEAFKIVHPKCLVNIKMVDDRNKRLYDIRNNK